MRSARRWIRLAGSSVLLTSMDTVKLTHLIITRFSLTGHHLTQVRIKPDRTRDPLLPANLRLRFKLFESICLPSVQGQSSPDFTWVILCDQALPAADRTRLESMVAAVPQAVLHEHDPAIDVKALKWTSPYRDESAERVATTLLDDDDALPRAFVEFVHSDVSSAAAAGELPPAKFMGTRQCEEWDLIISRGAPLGWRAPWHREKIDAVSCGFTLVCDPSIFDLSILAFRHRFASTYLDAGPIQSPGLLEPSRSQLWESAERGGHDVQTWDPDRVYTDFGTAIGPVVMANHTVNAVWKRLWLKKPGRTPVHGPDSFPHVSLDWQALKSHAREFGRIRSMSRTLARRIRMGTDVRARRQLADPSPRWRGSGGS